jgi:hypothetical protein
MHDAREFIYANGRLVERRLYAALFEEGDPEGVIDALRGYHNADGGFGHGLEPDKRIPTSQPLDVEIAFQTMDAVNRIDHDLVQRACDFLQAQGDGVGCLLGPFLNYPHAPHWGEWASIPSVNPTAGIAALLWKWGIDHPWRERATEFCFAQPLPEEVHGFGEVLKLVEMFPERQSFSELPKFAMFNLDPDVTEYGLTPLHFAPSPESRWTSLFEPELIDRHLDALAKQQCDDGGWPIAWTPLSAAAELECRSMETLRALRTLRAYGRG